MVGGAAAAPRCSVHDKLLPMPGCHVERITTETSELLHIAAHGTRPGGRCPDCGQASRAVHSRHRRKPADLPSLGRKVRVGLRVRRTCRLAETRGRVGAAPRWRGECEAAAPHGHAGGHRHGAAPDPPPAAARAGRGARRGHGRLGAVSGTRLRRHHGGHGPAARGRPAGGPCCRDRGGVAAAAARDRGGRARPLDRVRPCRRHRRAQGGPSGRQVASAGQHAPGGRALAARHPCPVPALAGAAGRRRGCGGPIPPRACVPAQRTRAGGTG